MVRGTFLRKKVHTRRIPTSCNSWVPDARSYEVGIGKTLTRTIVSVALTPTR